MPPAALRFYARPPTAQVHADRENPTMSEAVAVAPPAQAARPLSAADALDVDVAGGRGADVPGGTAEIGRAHV